MQLYLQLIKRYPAFLLFGFIATFASSFGQTFFIGLFNDSLRASHQLSHGEFGSLYAAATFLGGVLLMRIGGKLDQVPLAAFTSFTFIGLAVAALLASWNAHVVMLFVAIAGLRLFGQGFMGHVAMTSMARYFGANRGKAVAVAAMGFPLGEATLPIIMVVLVATIGWSAPWLLVAGLLLLLWPLMLKLQRHKPEITPATTSGNETEQVQLALRQRDLVRDPRFLAVVPALLGLPFIVTALLFNQLWLADQQSWSVAAVAGGLIVFSVTRVTVSLIAGNMIDKIGSDKLIGANILPATLGVSLLLVIDHVMGWWLFLGLAGFSAGINAAIGGTIWAELYGIQRLATVRALYHALMVFSTALSPLIMGLMIDGGYHMDTIMVLFTLILLLAWLNAQRLAGALKRANSA
ncbi:Predicted arabinose efflux permease, MFS family [Pseudidiomarina planktonica]|uniref:Predicted arabinose efflux permease, MFS family n=1 Tax=Pseudidiomarina planktonica TaxID=1323738 RepID=A0A1Y6EU20_9GAMM|nr:MFS transporter [Pseudidiomarina planktonica]RUO65256.1 MFS transporter [Pseudidiomarina planktonica]SMQ65796.1 Predicted arabinose efflux permease, MFS family [Pseudidiomarina planktonica]